MGIGFKEGKMKEHLYPTYEPVSLGWLPNII